MDIKGSCPQNHHTSNETTTTIKQLKVNIVTILCHFLLGRDLLWCFRIRCSSNVSSVVRPFAGLLQGHKVVTSPTRDTEHCMQVKDSLYRWCSSKEMYLVPCQTCHTDSDTDMHTYKHTYCISTAHYAE